MGNNSISPTHYHQPEWISIPSHHPHYTLLHNTLTSQFYQSHRRLFTNRDQFQSEKQKYLIRQAIQIPSILRVEAVKEHHISHMCSTSYELTLYVKHPIGDIRTVDNIDFPTAIYTLLQLLSAGKYLLREYPEFRMDESKIFLTSEGKIQVWISHLASDNEPENMELREGQENIEQEQKQVEEEEVQKILDIVEVRVRRGCMPVEFIKPLRFNYYNMEESINFIRRYCIKNRVEVVESYQKYYEEMERKSKEKQNRKASLGHKEKFKIDQGCNVLEQEKRPNGKYNHKILQEVSNLISYKK